MDKGEYRMQYEKKLKTGKYIGKYNPYTNEWKG